MRARILDREDGSCRSLADPQDTYPTLGVFDSSWDLISYYRAPRHKKWKIAWDKLFYEYRIAERLRIMCRVGMYAKCVRRYSTCWHWFVDAIAPGPIDTAAIKILLLLKIWLEFFPNSSIDYLLNFWKYRITVRYQVQRVRSQFPSTYSQPFVSITIIQEPRNTRLVNKARGFLRTGFKDLSSVDIAGQSLRNLHFHAYAFERKILVCDLPRRKKLPETAVAIESPCLVQKCPRTFVGTTEWEVDRPSARRNVRIAWEEYWIGNKRVVMHTNCEQTWTVIGGRQSGIAVNTSHYISNCLLFHFCILKDCLLFHSSRSLTSAWQTAS